MLVHSLPAKSRRRSVHRYNKIGVSDMLGLLTTSKARITSHRMAALMLGSKLKIKTMPVNVIRNCCESVFDSIPINRAHEASVGRWSGFTSVFTEVVPT